MSCGQHGLSVTEAAGQGRAMPPRKRKTPEPAAPSIITDKATREEVKAWLQGVLPKNVAKKLCDEWDSRNELFDGETLLAADEQLLMETGASRTVAHRIIAKLREMRQQQCEAPEPCIKKEAAEQADEQQGSPEQSIEAEEDAEELDSDAAAAALADHAVPLSGGRRGRGPGRRASQEQQEHYAQLAAEPPMLTRRQRQHRDKAAQRKQERGQAAEQQRGGEGQRPPKKSRISSVVVLQRQAQPAGHAERPTQQQQQQQATQPAAAAQAQGATAPRREGPPVLEDLGPESRNGQYRLSYEVRCRQGMEELLRDFMPLDKLRALVEDVAEEWSEEAYNCLREKVKRDGHMRWQDHKRNDPIVKKLMKLLFTGAVAGRPTEDMVGGMSKGGLKELLESEHCREAVQAYVEQRVRPRYQNLPDEEPLNLLWKLWSFPQGPARPIEDVLLGSRRLRYVSIGGSAAEELEPCRDGYVPWEQVWAAIHRGDLELEGQEELMQWLEEVDAFYDATKCSVHVQMFRQTTNRSLKVYLWANWPTDRPGSNLVSTVFKEENEFGMEEAKRVDLALLLGQCDQHRGTPFAAQMARMKAALATTERQVEARGLDSELPAEAPLSKGQFDSIIKPLVEAVERPMPANFKQQCDSTFKLTLSSYQLRTVAHMLAEEQAPGGSARHLWVQLNLPELPEVYAYVSPILGQIRFCTSKIEAQQWVHSCGGAGLVALEVGMGKTACAVAITQLNPPPADWRKNRAYQTTRANDHLAAHVNNLPHGGTLIVVPTAIVNQWADEFRKTTGAPLTICKWVDGTKKEPLHHDCKLLARFDVVITDTNTLKNSSNMASICNIFWHRVIVDETQLQGGFLSSKEHMLLACHRWALTGTPDNDNNLDTMAALYSYLKLAPHNPIFSHFPAALAHTLKNTMVFYSRAGRLDGRVNLQLQPTQDKVVEWSMNEDDAFWYKHTAQDMQQKFASLARKCGVDMSELPEVMDQPGWSERRLKFGKAMTKLRNLVVPLRQAAGGAYRQPTGAEYYDPAKGQYVAEKYAFTSKVDAVLDVLRRKGPKEKVVVFSEFKATLQAIKRRLPELGLDCRDLLGNASADKRGLAIADFQMAPPTQVFLLTHRTGGAGVTLTAGSHVVLCEPVLNPSFEEQAIGRCNRLGQQRAVTVTRLVMKGTIEEKIVEFMSQLGGSGDADDEDGATLDRSSKLTIEDVHWFICDNEEVGEC